MSPGLPVPTAPRAGGGRESLGSAAFLSPGREVCHRGPSPLPGSWWSAALAKFPGRLLVPPPAPALPWAHKGTGGAGGPPAPPPLAAPFLGVPSGVSWEYSGSPSLLPLSSAPACSRFPFFPRRCVKCIDSPWRNIHLPFANISHPPSQPCLYPSSFLPSRSAPRQPLVNVCSRGKKKYWRISAFPGLF